jgi:hypothetical protein
MSFAGPERMAQELLGIVMGEEKKKAVAKGMAIKV